MLWFNGEKVIFIEELQNGYSRIKWFHNTKRISRVKTKLLANSKKKSKELMK